MDGRIINGSGEETSIRDLVERSTHRAARYGMYCTTAAGGIAQLVAASLKRAGCCTTGRVQLEAGLRFCWVGFVPVCGGIRHPLPCASGGLPPMGATSTGNS